MFATTQHYKQIKNNPEKVWNIKSFLDLYNWKSIEYQAVIEKIIILYSKKKKASINCFNCASCWLKCWDTWDAKVGFEQFDVRNKSVRQLYAFNQCYANKSIFVTNSPKYINWRRII